MTYLLETLHSKKSTTSTTPATSGWGRFAQELTLVLALLGLAFWLVALLSYSPQDAAWTTTGVVDRAHALSTHNLGGRLGAWLADMSYFFCGFSVAWLWLVGARMWLSSLASWLRGEPIFLQRRFFPERLKFWFFFTLLLLVSSQLEWSRLYRFEFALPGHAGGVLGYLTGSFGLKWLGFTGSGLVGIALGVVSVGAVFGFTWAGVAQKIGSWLDNFLKFFQEKREIAQDLAVGRAATREREEVLEEERIEQQDYAPPTMLIEPTLLDIPQSKRVAKEKQKPLFSEMPDSNLPQVDLLDHALVRQETVSPETLEMTSRLIEKKLKDFGVEVRVIAAAPGPVITRYEIEPAVGVKGSQVVNLAKDLARSLSLVSIRVIETIPGKNFMALELPNAKRQTIKLSEILGSQTYNEAKSLLTMGLGKDISGNAVVADLAKMPHCLVAGTTGSGKSVGINAMILSLLYKADARDVRLLLIDPKMLEMSVYEGIPHLLAPVVTDMRQAAHGLNWCVAEMERRYKLMSRLGVRNLAGYNQKIQDAKDRGEILGNPFSLTPEQPEPLENLPFIVVVIDELADLMMVVGKKIEELIARLAQKARAAGIHLILATQRPSVDVITGLIKANIPTRLSFQVSSKIDSRTILDQMGAEALLGMGDMLYMPSGTGFPVRVHGAFVSDDEVHRVVAYLKKQGEPNYITGVLEGGTVDDEADALGAAEGPADKDPLYDQAVEIVLKNRRASISLVQRHLKIGYNRAARMLEEMEKSGLISAMSGSGQRDILVPAGQGASLRDG